MRRENRDIARLWRRAGPRRFTLPLHPPLDPLPEGGRFGSRRVINDQPKSPHSGADYSAPAGVPVLAAVLFVLGPIQSQIVAFPARRAEPLCA